MTPTEQTRRPRYVFHSLSSCTGCEVWGDAFMSVNVEAYEVTGELYCDDCAGDVLAVWAEDNGGDA